jgi:homoserine dehydrogenase
MSSKVRVGLLGLGTVGRSVFDTLSANHELISARAGADVEVAAVAVKSLDHDWGIDRSLLTDDALGLASDPSIDVVVEVMGGENPAGDCIRASLSRGASAVSANKELIAKQIASLVSLAQENGADFRFEAAVGGGIPILQPLQHQLGSNRFIELKGILNGTTNHILTEMRTRGISFDEALDEAQDLGYAEADPTADVDGWDALYKITILSSLITGQQVSIDSASLNGIRGIALAEIEAAEAKGERLKLIASAQFGDAPEISVSVQSLPHEHPLAAISGATNALWIQADPLGEVTLSGPGAGGGPTAAAVVGDIVEAVRCRNMGTVSPPWPISS